MSAMTATLHDVLVCFVWTDESGDGGAEQDELSSDSGSDWDMPGGQQSKGNRRALVASDDDSLDLD